MLDAASRVSAISFATRNKLYEYKTETDVNYCKQIYSERTLRLYFVCNCTPKFELFDQGSYVKIVTRPKDGRVKILPVIGSVIFSAVSVFQIGLDYTQR
jgi:hypothetical protein